LREQQSASLLQLAPRFMQAGWHVPAQLPLTHWSGLLQAPPTSAMPGVSHVWPLMKSHIRPQQSAFVLQLENSCPVELQLMQTPDCVGSRLLLHLLPAVVLQQSRS
jgi:hypothetical protein